MKKDGKFRNGKIFAISKLNKIPQHCTHAPVSHQLCSGNDLQMSDKIIFLRRDQVIYS